MTGEECRAARDALQLSFYDLARLAGLAEITVKRFELGRTTRPGTVIALRKAIRRAAEGRGPVLNWDERRGV